VSVACTGGAEHRRPAPKHSGVTHAARSATRGTQRTTTPHGSVGMHVHMRALRRSRWLVASGLLGHRWCWTAGQIATQESELKLLRERLNVLITGNDKDVKDLRVRAAAQHPRHPRISALAAGRAD
jgi:hypothetical protein